MLTVAVVPAEVLLLRSALGASTAVSVAVVVVSVLSAQDARLRARRAITGN